MLVEVNVSNRSKPARESPIPLPILSDSRHLSPHGWQTKHWVLSRKPGSSIEECLFLRMLAILGNQRSSIDDPTSLRIEGSSIERSSIIEKSPLFLAYSVLYRRPQSSREPSSEPVNSLL
jgi:hypothetical protein